MSVVYGVVGGSGISIDIFHYLCNPRRQLLFMDNFSFASLAYVRILLLPVGLIPQASFESYAAEIRSFESIRLGEIPADIKGGKGILDFTLNSLVFSYTIYSCSISP